MKDLLNNNTRESDVEREDIIFSFLLKDVYRI